MIPWYVLSIGLVKKFFWIFHKGMEKPGASQVTLVVKNPPANAGDIETQVQNLGQEDPPEEGMVILSSFHA